MRVVSKLEEVISQFADSVIQWLDELSLNPLAIKLNRCVDVMLQRVHNLASDVFPHALECFRRYACDID